MSAAYWAEIFWFFFFFWSFVLYSTCVEIVGLLSTSWSCCFRLFRLFLVQAASTFAFFCFAFPTSRVVCLKMFAFFHPRKSTLLFFQCWVENKLGFLVVRCFPERFPLFFFHCPHSVFILGSSLVFLLLSLCQEGDWPCSDSLVLLSARLFLSPTFCLFHFALRFMLWVQFSLFLAVLVVGFSRAFAGLSGWSLSPGCTATMISVEWTPRTTVNCGSDEGCVIIPDLHAVVFLFAKHVPRVQNLHASCTLPSGPALCFLLFFLNFESAFYVPAYSSFSSRNLWLGCKHHVQEMICLGFT